MIFLLVAITAAYSLVTINAKPLDNDGAEIVMKIEKINEQLPGNERRRNFLKLSYQLSFFPLKLSSSFSLRRHIFSWTSTRRTSETERWITIRCEEEKVSKELSGVLCQHKGQWQVWKKRESFHIWRICWTISREVLGEKCWRMFAKFIMINEWYQN